MPDNGETTMKTLLRLTVAGPALGLALTGAAAAECGIESGSVRILGNDFDALRVVTGEAQACASDAVEVTVNLTTEHKNIQVPALTVDPAEYTVAIVANNSIVPLMNEGLIRPLDDLVAEYGGDLAPGQLIRVGDEVVAVAFMGNAQHLFFRRDVLEQVGMEPPATYEEVLEAAEAIRAAGIMEHPLAATNAAGWYLAAEFVNMHLGMGGEFFEPGTAEPAVADETGIRTLEMMKALAGYMGPEFLSYSADEMKKLYLAGEVAMMNQWGSMVEGHLADDAGAPAISAATGLAPAPKVAGGAVPAAALWWDGFAIARNVSDEDAAASFRAMVHAIRPEVAKENPAAATWLIPGFEPTRAAEGVLGTAAAGARAYPMSPYMGLMHSALGAELAEYMQGLESAEEALADVEAAYRASAREAGFLN
jgi:ABC-type glycerol-3-phosphate transport system substrate-binding protein